MLEKYRATIHGKTIEWDGDEPEVLRANGEITVDITVVNDKNSTNKIDSKRAVAALRKIAARGGVKSIPDPDKWLREVRKDRPLPGR
ncbi:MAG: hypothetical protein WBD16_12795 [Pyrinomonadaceae bacterium]